MQLQKFYCNSYTTHSTHGVTYYDLMGYRDERSWQHITHISPTSHPRKWDTRVLKRR